ncbi:MAG: LicD family protein, partial [Solobacterium sp.]|nr:LicD family protein [Solobacterium sp.]
DYTSYGPRFCSFWTTNIIRDLFYLRFSVTQFFGLGQIIPERKWYLNLIIRIIKAFSPKGKRRELIQKQDTFCQKYAGDELTTYVGYPCAAMKQELLKGEWFKETEVVPFEQYAFRIPKGYKECLNVFYGPTYMELPPAEKQKTHHAYHVWYKEEVI